jgi:hypothetical protein
VLDHLRGAPDARGDDRRSHGHRLEQDVGQPFAQRGQHRHGGLGHERRDIATKTREDDVAAHAEPRRLCLEHGPKAGLARAVGPHPGCGRFADDDEARFRNLPQHSRRGLEEVLDALARDQAADEQHDRRPGVEGVFGAQRRRRRRRLEAGEVDAVGDDADAGFVVAVLHQPAAHGLGVDQHAVGEAAGPSLRAPLGGVQIHAHVADRRDHRRHAGQARGGNGKHVAVEVVSVDDVDLVAPQLPGKPQLGQRRVRVVEAADRVLPDGDVVGPQLVGQRAPQAQAPELDVKALGVEPDGQIGELAFRAAVAELGDELDQVHAAVAGAYRRRRDDG